MMTQYYKAQMAMNSHDWEGFLNAVIVIYTELNEPMPDLLDLCASKRKSIGWRKGKNYGEGIDSFTESFKRTWEMDEVEMVRE